MKHVVYVTDAKQADVLAVSLFSLLEHLSAGNEVVVHVLWAGRAFTGAERGRVLDVCRRHDFRRIEFHDINGDFGRYADVIHGNMIWGRVFFASFVDEKEGNVLYLDTDTLVCEDVSELFSLNLGQNLVAAVSEAQFVTAEERRDYTSAFLPSEVWRYFNSGVLVINLKRFRDEGVAEQVLKWYSEHRNESLCPDQDALNAVAARRVLFLHPKYNYNDGWLARQCRCSMCEGSWRGCKPVEVLEAALRPSICHYVGSKKPWRPTHRPERKAYRVCMRELGLALPGKDPLELAYDVWHLVLKRIIVPFRLACARCRAS